MASLDILTDENNPNIKIKAPALDATRLTSYFAAAVAIGTPILAWVTDQEEAVRQTALMIMLVAIPAIAFVVAADIFSRAFVEAHSPAENSAEGPAKNLPFNLAGGGDIRVRVSGEGKDPFRLLGVRWDEKASKWQYWVGRAGALRWVDEEKVDEFVS